LRDPKKKQRNYYSGKKKKHTLKTQIVVNKLTAEIICIHTGQGKSHDFRIYKESNIHITPEVYITVDSGYQGLQKIHANTELPKKKTKKNPLSDEDKKKNSALASKRVLNENIIGVIKRFRITSDKYRNRKKRFNLRFNLIAGIYNFELNL
jgi:hypothetical protein